MPAAYEAFLLEVVRRRGYHQVKKNNPSSTVRYVNVFGGGATPPCVAHQKRSSKYWYGRVR